MSLFSKQMLFSLRYKSPNYNKTVAVDKILDKLQE